MIGLMLEGAGQQFLCGLFEGFSVHVLSADGDFLGAPHIFAKVGNTEAAFVLSVAPFGMNDLRINEDEFGVWIFLEGYIDDSDAAGDTDLRCGQTDAMG